MNNFARILLFLCFFVIAMIEAARNPTTKASTTTTTTTESPTTSTTPAPPPIKTKLMPNECLKHGEFIESPNKCFRMIFQADGNVVIYRMRDMGVVWSSKTERTCTNNFCMQRDGNLVAYDCHGIATWNSHTAGHPGSAVYMQDDANLVIYKTGHPVLGQHSWASFAFSGC